MLPASAAGKFNWKQCSGSELSVWLANDPGFTDVIQQKLPEFEALTGIKVKFDTMHVNNYRTRLPVELAARSNSFDVMNSFGIIDGKKFSMAGWYEDLDKYLKDRSLTSSDFMIKDFLKGSDKLMYINNKRVIIPYMMQTLLLFYRKDLFKEAGIKVPATFKQLEEAAAKLNQPDKGVYGIGMRGRGYEMTSPFASFLYGMGGSWLDDKGNPSINTKQALAAFELYGRLCSKYGPPGIVNWGWTQVTEGISQGRVAMTIDINNLAPSLEDPNTSKVAGKVGYAVVPAGPAGPKPFIGGMGFAISSYAEHKKEAWLFIQWASSNGIHKQVRVNGWPSPRKSAWDAIKGSDRFPELSQAMLGSFNVAHPYMNPPIISALDARTIIGRVGDLAVQGVTGEQLKKAADSANKELEDLIANTQ